MVVYECDCVLRQWLGRQWVTDAVARHGGLLCDALVLALLLLFVLLALLFACIGFVDLVLQPSRVLLLWLVPLAAPASRIMDRLLHPRTKSRR